MATIRLPPDFKDFLRLLTSNEVEYLVVGGYAVGYYGYPRPTGDLDIWVACNPDNASKLVEVMRQFGFSAESVSEEIFLQEGKVIRMGVPPLRIELLTGISGVDFATCFLKRHIGEIDGIKVNLIDVSSLRENKKAAGRPKDQNDLDNLP